MNSCIKDELGVNRGWREGCVEGAGERLRESERDREELRIRIITSGFLKKNLFSEQN